jgi:hypothetical protein
MAAAPIILIAEAIKAIGVAVGVGVGVGIATEEAKKRTKDNTEAKDRPVAKTETSTKEDKKTCDACPPDCGELVSRRWNMSEQALAYQARITGFAPGTEWQFGGVDFDGFKSGECTLQEAKAAYDQFFDKDTGKPKRFFAFFSVDRMLRQAKRQSDVAVPKPRVKLHWYFMQPVSYAYFAPLLADYSIQVFYQP